jgi:hypothetical protein
VIGARVGREGEGLMADYSLDLRIEPPEGEGFDLDQLRTYLAQLAEDFASADVIEISVASENPDVQSSIVETLSDTEPASCDRKQLLVAYIGRCPPKMVDQPQPVPLPIPGEPRT